MKILAIMGSPHKGNTLELTERFEQKLKSHGEVDFEYVHLKDVNIEPCRGCFICFLKGEDKCPIKNDEKAIVAKKMDDADGVIFVSPVYAMNVSSLFKKFLDRFAYIGHRPRFFGKHAIVLAATGGVGLDETLKYMKDWIEALGFEVVDSLGYFAPPKNTSYPTFPGKGDRTEQAARAFYRAVLEKNPRKLKLKDFIHFKVMRAVYSRMRTMSPADYEYYEKNGWFEPGRKYFTDHAKGCYIKSLVADFIAWQIGRGMDKQIKKTESEELKG